jgi:hypothetical protein
MKKIDFTNPILGRRWLSLLKPCIRYGFSFEKNVSLAKRYLGFRFKSNMHGLRGPENIHADTVIAGTSYAMGMSVNNGYDWYDLSSRFTDSLNVAIPTSIVEQTNRLKDIYSGNYNHLIYIYHPNIWLIAKQFNQSRLDKKDIKSSMRWKTGYKSLPLLYVKWTFKTLIKIKQNILFLIKFGELKYRIDSRYCLLKLKRDESFYIDEINAFQSLFALFDRVTVVRVPIKEQIYFDKTKDVRLNNLMQSYDDNWCHFKQTIAHDFDVLDLYEERNFKLEHYLPFDTHWNEKGNVVFHTELCKFLDKNKL